MTPVANWVWLVHCAAAARNMSGWPIDLPPARVVFADPDLVVAELTLPCVIVAKRKRRAPPIEGSCPCGGELDYADCCRPLHDDVRPASTAVDVMRARYSAHVFDRDDYLRRSWHPETCPETIAVSDSSERWLGLEMLDVDRGGALDAEGTVEFVARFRVGEVPRTLHERSRFVRLAGRWVYYDGVLEF